LFDTQNSNGTESQKHHILHVCTRDVLRTVRDQIMSVAGYDVDSCETHEEALAKATSNRYDLILIDIDSQHNVRHAEELCSAIKTADPKQRVVFVCNWRVAILNECPDDIVRSEFDPVGFLSGVAAALQDNEAG